MRRIAASALVAVAWALPAAARAEDDATKSRLEALERKVEEQRAELDRLRDARMLEELRRAGDAPPHVDRAPDRADAASGSKDGTFDWGYDDGFLVKGEINGARYVLRPRAYIQLDYRAFVHAGANLALPTKGTPEDRFVVRRAVVGFRGQFGSFDFLLEADPTRNAANQIPLLNFFLEWHELDEVKIRAGHYIPPFTLGDGFTAPPFHELIEQAMIVQSLSYSFRPGAMVSGEFAKGLFSYFLSANNELDSNNVVTGDPIITARLASRVGGFGFGAAGSWVRLGGPTHNSITGSTPGQHTFFAAVPVRGWSQRYEVDAFVDAGPFFATAEYGWAAQQRDRANTGGSDGAPLIAQGAYATVGWMFVGPPPGVKGPHIPFKDWDFSLDLVRKRNARNVGAEVLCRVEWIAIDQARGDRDFKGNSAKAVAVGVNVYPMENVRLTLEYVHVHVGDQSRAERAHSREGDELLFRAQLEF